MSRATDRQTNNIVIGAGECFIDLLNASEVGAGERYLGDSPGGTLRVESEETEVIAGDGAVPRKLASVVTNINRSFEIQLQDLSPDNLALFLYGTASTQVDEQTVVARAQSTALNVKQGHWYQIGKSDSKPTGYAAVKKAPFNAYSQQGVGGTTYTATTFHADGRVNEVGDYTLDHEHGRIYIEPGKRIANESDIFMAYTSVARTVNTVVANLSQQVKASFRYIESAVQGHGNNYYVPVASVRPAGDLALKDRASPQSMTLNLEVLQPANGVLAPLYVNGQSAV